MPQLDKFSNDKLQKIVSVYIAEGDEATRTQFSLSSETLNRYLREARKRGMPLTDKNKIMSQILQNYSEKELDAIAKGGRIVPGYGKVPIVNFEGQRIRVGAMTDTHIGSNKMPPDRIYQAFEEFKKEKVDFITHSGDVTEGMNNRPGHVYELSDIGYANQKRASIEIFSQWTDTDIYAIDGNHDRWFIKSNGAKIVEDIDKEVPNFHFIGHDEGDISLKGKATLKLWHGEDSNSYALCFDTETEVFTDNGWYKFSELPHNVSVATLNPATNAMEFQMPYDYIDMEYNGKMIHFDGQKYDALVTPNHRMWVRRKWDDKWRFVYASDITKGRQWAINRVIPNWEGNNSLQIILPKASKGKTGKTSNNVDKVDAVLWAEFVGWMLSEGNISHANQRVEISQRQDKNPKKYQRIIDLVHSIGYRCYGDGGRICITSKQLYEIFQDMGHSHEKRVHPNLKSATKPVLLALLDGLFMGDGTIKNGRYQNYTTNSKGLADDIQEVLMKCGIAATIKRYDDRKSNFNQTRPVYQLSCSYKMTEPELFNKPKQVDYEGRVYCVSVPNQTLLVRRNGKVMWSGNSYRLQKILESLTGGEKPNAMLCGHTHKYVDIFERHVFTTSIGSMQSQTPWMRGKRIAAHTGFAIIDYWVNDKGICKKTSTWHPFYS